MFIPAPALNEEEGDDGGYNPLDSETVVMPLVQGNGNY